MARADGKRVRNTEPMYAIIPYILKYRYDSMNYITEYIPYRPIHDYIRAKRKEGYRFSHMSVLLAAYTRCVAEFPYLNRFVVNKKIYSRNELCVSMVVLRPGDVDGTMSKVYFEKTDTIYDVDRKINEFVNGNRAGAETNSTDKLMKVLLSVPGLVNAGIGLFKWLDLHGLLPKAIINASPFHCSLVISNLASIRTNHIYHHCYDFGTTSVVMAAGNSREVAKRKGGEIVFEKCLPLGVVMDERIASGSYFAMAFRRMKQYLKDPSLLETPPTEVKPDPEI
jgi:hypothetical protein